MKEYIKKFNTLVSANNYDIADIPFTSTVGGTFINLVCNTPNKRIVVEDNTLYIFTVITGTWNPSLTDKTTKVIISGNVTLNCKTDCYSLMFEEGGHLTISAGARLRVWKGGITNNDCGSVNYLTIVEDVVNDSYGEFLLHPDVTVNNHPLASVKLISRSCYRYPAQANINQHFGIPMAKDGLQSIIASGNHETRFFAFDYTTGKWKALGYINPSPGYESQTLNINDLNNPFEYYQLLDFVATTPETGATYTMNGYLYGNDNPQLNVRGNSVNGFANSYIGTIKTSLLLSLLAEHNILSMQVGSDDTEINASNVGQWPYIQPVYCRFIISNTGAQFNLTLPYKDLVWNPSFEEGVTPTRSLLNGSLMSPKPTEINTTLEGSGIFDNPEPVFPPEHDEK